MKKHPVIMIKIKERAETCLQYILPVFLPLMCFAQSGTLPVLHINTVDNKPITSKTVYLPGSYWIEPNGLAEAEGDTARQKIPYSWKSKEEETRRGRVRRSLTK